jgi:hypothetical protein
MSDLNPRKLKITFRTGKFSGEMVLPRRYTLTHSDRTGELFLTIGDDYDQVQISGLYTKLMRDEVLAEWQDGTQRTFHVYCHVSGCFVVGSAQWRSGIFKYHMPMILQAFRHGDQGVFDLNPELDKTEIWVHFHSKQEQFNVTEFWGTFADYKLGETQRSEI